MPGSLANSSTNRVTDSVNIRREFLVSSTRCPRLHSTSLPSFLSVPPWCPSSTLLFPARVILAGELREHVAEAWHLESVGHRLDGGGVKFLGFLLGLIDGRGQQVLDQLAIAGRE